ncbi:MAG: hypothetical protein V1851_02260 [Patescibacteria group bacterium]
MKVEEIELSPEFSLMAIIVESGDIVCDHIEYHEIDKDCEDRKLFHCDECGRIIAFEREGYRG